MGDIDPRASIRMSSAPYIRALKLTVAAISVIVTILVVVAVLFRFVFQAPVLGLEELVLHGMMWLYMIGASLASHDDSHLKGEIIDTITTNARVLAATRIVAGALSLAISIFVVVWSFDLVVWGIEKRQTTPVFDIPWLVSQSSLLFFSVTCTACLAAALYRETRAMFPRAFDIGKM